MAICLIPARSGSRRVPDKNIQPFRGRPIIHWPLAAALDTGLFDHVFVSTDSQGYVEIAEQIAGVRAFLRSPENATDTAPLEDVLAEAMDAYPAERLWCMLLPTAVGVTAHDLKTAYIEMYYERALVTVTEDSQTAERALRVTHDGRLVPCSRLGIRKRTQDTQPTYHDAGQFYWVRRQPFLWRWRWLRQDLLLQRPSYYVVPGAVDIDTEADLEAAR